MDKCLITIISMEIYQNGTQVLSRTCQTVRTLNHDLIIVTFFWPRRIRNRCHFFNNFVFFLLISFDDFWISTIVQHEQCFIVLKDSIQTYLSGRRVLSQLCILVSTPTTCVVTFVEFSSVCFRHSFFFFLLCVLFLHLCFSCGCFLV